MTSRLSVLVVDDDRISAPMVEHTLERGGLDVDFTSALLLRRELDRSRPDALLLNTAMLNDRAIELIRQLRGIDSWAAVPMLVLTWNGDTRDVVFAFDAGADDYIVKPFDPDELLARLRRLLRVQLLSA